MRRKFLQNQSVNKIITHCMCVVFIFVLIINTAKAQPECDNALSGTVYVGAGGGSPSYAGFKELFDAINTLGIKTNLLVLVQSDVSESATAVLNPVVYQCDETDLSIRIEPVDDVVRTITNATSGALMQLNGVVNLVIDGSYEGSGRYLRFRSAVANQSVLILNNGTHECEFRNSIFEASGASTVGIRLGTGSGLAITDILFDGNDIRNRSDITQNAASLTRISLVSIGGGTTEKNERITITNNLFSAFSQSGIDIGLQTSVASSGNLEYYLGASAFAGTNNGSYFTIDNNRFFAPIAMSAGHVGIPIKFNPGTASHSNSISGNIIGGNASDNSGTLTYSSNNGFSSMYVGVGGSSDEEATVIANNTIHRISLTGLNSTWQRFGGIELVGSGRVNVTGNTVGSLTQANSITSTANGFNNYQFISFIYGIWNCSTGEVHVEDNAVANITSTASAGITTLSGICNGVRLNFNGVAPTTLINIACGKVKVNNNIVTALTTPSKSWRNAGTNMAPVHPGALSGIVVMSNSPDNEVLNNQVYNLHNVVPGALHRSTVVVGIAMDGTGPAGTSSTGIVSGNKVYDLRNDHQNNGNATDRPEVIGISLGMLIGVTSSGTTQGRGHYTLTNNMISLAPEVPANSTMVVGIMDQIQSPSVTRVYNNSVYIGGSGINSLTPSAPYFHFPNRNRACTDGESYVQNNIFINQRTGMTNAFAIASLVNGTPVIESDNNLIASNSADQVGSWQGTGGDFAAWQTNSGGDDTNSINALVIPSGSSSSTEINPTELFQDPLSDLHLIDPPVTPWPLNFVAGQGVPIAAVTLDIDGEERSGTTPFLGADEAESACEPPSIDQDLSESTIGCYSNNLALSVAVSGSDPLTYVWQLSTNDGSSWSNINNGGKYSGATTATLSITNLIAGMSGYQYQVLVTNECGSITSGTTILTMQVCPPNDNPLFSNPSLTSAAYVYPNCYQISGSTVGATVNTATGERDVWYQFVAAYSGVRIQVSSSQIDPKIYLFASSNLSTPLDIEDVVVGNGTEIMNFVGLTPGNAYRIAIASEDENDGSFDVCLQGLRPANCGSSGPFTLCSAFLASPTGATNTTFSFTQGANPPTSVTGTGLIVLSNPALQLAYNTIYTVGLTANYHLQNGAGTPELIQIANPNACSVTIGNHPLVEVKSNMRCSNGATLLRSAYLIGATTTGTNICGITGYRVEFTPVSNCAGDNPQTLETFTRIIAGSTASISLSYAFNHIPLAGNPNIGHWSVRWRPIYSGVEGTYGPARVIAVNGTAPASIMQESSSDAIASNPMSEISFGLYPNPNNGELVNLNLTGVTSDQVFVRIMDAMGRVVYTNRYAVEGSLNTVVNFSKPLTSGLYLVEFREGNNVITQRMMVSK